MDSSANTSAPRSVRSVLARALARVTELDPSFLDETELVRVVTDCADLAAATAGLKLAAVAELCERFEEHDHGPIATGAECAGAEVSLALRLTPAATDRLVVLAHDLANRLPVTATALRGARISEDKARVLGEETSNVSLAIAAQVEERAVPWAPRLTTPRFRRRVRMLVIDTDPEGAAERRDAAMGSRRVGLWDDGEGTAALAGSSLAAGPALEAYHHLDAVARALHRTEEHHISRPRTLEQIRADVFVDLLRGHTTTMPTVPSDPCLVPASATAPLAKTIPRITPEPGTGSGQLTVVAGEREALITAVGRLHLTIPFDTLIGAGQAAGEAAGYGPLLADVARQLAERALASPGSTLACWTITDERGEAISHGASSYSPSPRMRAAILARHTTCAFPTCGQPSTRCDLDHTTAYDAGGKTCPCNLVPLCRRHHRLKQHRDWHTAQLNSGQLTWTTPTGVRHISHPSARDSPPPPKDSPHDPRGP